VRLVLAGGGTGGHVYPGLAVAEALRREVAGADLLYIGRAGGPEERIVRAAGLPFTGVSAAGVRGKTPLAAARGVLALLRGTAQAWRVLGRFRPRAVFATGGYASVPVALAARARRVPVLVYLPDVHPGWAVRLLARLAARVAVTSARAAAHLPRGRTAVTGYPVRPAFFAVTRPRARERLGLPPRRPVLLVAGGSSGSRDLNRALARHLPQFLALAEVVHSCGAPFEAELRRLAERVPAPLRGRYHLYAYLDDMPAAMAAADLAVMRAGASTLGELPAVGLPAVLVPGPFSDQGRNARYLAERGAAVVLPNDRLDDLLAVVRRLLTDPERLAAMRRAMTALARPTAAADLARLLLEVAA
jgi:UDP-N-acetylglucosamine--N-acetylmuramyl-(pentapeptide) pyrophosphoryl-undecaprenol N-acetylglucosamine transferase